MSKAKGANSMAIANKGGDSEYRRSWKARVNKDNISDEEVQA